MTIATTKLNRRNVERMLADAGMRPEKKMTLGDRELYIADGFAAPAFPKLARFGVTRGEYPFGAYCTIWFLAKGEDFFEVGRPMLFDAFHDPNIPHSSKQDARINTAIKNATDISQRRKVVRRGLGLH